MTFEKNIINSAEIKDEKQEKIDEEKIIFSIIEHGRITQDLQKKEEYRELLREKIRASATNKEFLEKLFKYFSIPKQEDFLESVLYVKEIVDFLIPSKEKVDIKKIEKETIEKEQEIKLNVIQIDDVLVPTYGTARIELGNEPFKEKQIILRTKYLQDLLDENGITLDQYIRIKGKILKQ